MANLEVLALDTVTPQIRAPGAGDGYSVPRDMTLASGTTLTAPTVNATTVDATNVEVTNVKAKDGTAAITIADSTGNVGIGVTPTVNLDVKNAGGNCTISAQYGTGTKGQLIAANNEVVLKAFNGTNDVLTFYTGTSERMRLDASGNLGIGTTSPQKKFVVSDAGNIGIELSPNDGGTSLSRLFSYNRATAAYVPFVFQGDNIQFGTGSAATERMRIDASGNVGIGGTASASEKVVVTGTLPSGSSTTFGVRVTGTIPSTSTVGAIFQSIPATQAASFTVSDLTHFGASQQTFGAGSTVTNQLGFHAQSTLTGATNNYGFYSNIAAGSNRWNLYCAGTAENYVANNLKIGGTAARATTAGTNQLVLFDGTAPVGTLANGVSFYSASGEANVMDAAGNATLLSPHDSETNEWIFRSKHTPSGKVLRIDVEKMLRFINEHFDLDMVQEWTE